jgi:hypothetical protein
MSHKQTDRNYSQVTFEENVPKLPIPCLKRRLMLTSNFCAHELCWSSSLSIPVHWSGGDQHENKEIVKPTKN